MGKALAFTLVILAAAPGWASHDAAAVLTALAYSCVYATVILCVVRGLPVLVEARRFFEPPGAGGGAA